MSVNATKRLTTDQRGSVLIWTVLFLGLFMAGLALAADFGFQRVQRIRLQTAADAAALAGAREHDIYADITVHARQWHEECLATDKNGNCTNLHQEWHYADFPASRVLARNAESAARAACPADWSYMGFTENRRWAELRTGNGPEAAARTAYEANTRRVAGAGQPRITRAGRDAVVVDARAEQQPFLLRLFGIRRLDEDVTGGAVAKPR